MLMITRFRYTFNYVTDKGSGRLNEDAYVANSNTGVFAVFDGVSSLNEFSDKSGKTGGFLASNIAKEVFGGGKKDLVSLIAEANARIKETMLKEKVDIKDKLNLWGTTVAAIKLSKDTFDWIQVADTLILVIYRNGKFIRLVDKYNHDREVLTLMKKLAEKGVENPREEISAPLAALRRKSNITYGVLTGEKRIGFLHSGTNNLKDVRTILIFSDGLLIPKTDPNEDDDFGAIVKEYINGGLIGWLKKVRDMENSDLSCQRYIRYKLHDDATAVAVSFQ